MTQAPAASARAYGGWRRSRRMGLWGLGPGQTLAVLGALLAVAFAGSVSLTATAATAAPALLVLGAAVLRWNGTSLLARGLARIQWLGTRALGLNHYRAGTLVSRWQLPGPLAFTELHQVDDPAGSFGVVRNRRAGLLTATLRVAATSTWLVDQDQTNTWVANWGNWLAGLGYLSTVRWISVTVDTGPGSGATIPDAVRARISPTAPALAQRILRRLAETVPTTTAAVRTWISITADPALSPARPKALPEQLQELARLLPGLEDALAGCGVSILGRATALQIAAAVRRAFDPHASDDLDRDHTGLLDWATAGPIAADEYRDRYEHDGAISVSWAWHEAPRQHVHADVLARLLAPGPHRRRVTLLYRPLPAAEAARVVDREVNAAAFRDALRAARRKDESARDRADRERALRAAREEALGAGVGLMNLFVTTTVNDPIDLDRAIADIETRAETARIRLRRVWAGQAAALTVTLPCGVCPGRPS